MSRRPLTASSLVFRRIRILLTRIATRLTITGRTTPIPGLTRTTIQGSLLASGLVSAGAAGFTAVLAGIGEDLAGTAGLADTVATGKRAVAARRIKRAAGDWISV